MTDTINDVPRELLERVLYLMDNYIGTTHPEEDEIRAILSAPSPAGVYGLGNTAKLLLPALRQYMHNDGSGLLAGYDLETTQAIIDGLAVENHQLRRELNLRQSQIESSGRIAERAQRFAIQLRTERDKHAQRIGELAAQANVNCKNTAYYLRKYRPDLADICSGLCAAIDAALSAGKEGE